MACQVPLKINIIRQCTSKPSFLLRKYFARNIGHIAECNAVILKEFGDPRKVLTIEKCEVATPSEHNVLVKMLMAPINPSDINTIEGTYHIRPKLPAFVGNEGVGEVVEVGNNVKDLKKGDWVIPSEAAWGTWREYAVTDESKVQKIDNDIPLLSAATIMVNPCTAYRMLKDFEHLEKGDVIIQNGANSAVGQCVIQLAKEWGIKTINIIRDRPDIDDLSFSLKELGATEVVTEEFVRTPAMKELISYYGHKPKLALNCVGGKSATELIRFLNQGGTMVTYGGMSKKPVLIPTGALIFKEVKLVGYWNTQWNVLNKNSIAKVKMYTDLCSMIRNCKLLPPKSELVSLENFSEAIQKSMEGFQDRKQVLEINQ